LAPFASGRVASLARRTRLVNQIYSDGSVESGGTPLDTLLSALLGAIPVGLGLAS
jgi:hypothetical protein